MSKDRLEYVAIGVWVVAGGVALLTWVVWILKILEVIE